ncbi:hypothetical protein ABZZ74_20100 [Streptomyces sp. NPDC006476]|uniref:hypothetical protein n=1 Tax=Streptomyces sp. NPDC006476 TaxID=3157175 RepID=UPI00339FE1B5
MTPADPAGDGPGASALPDALFDPASVAVVGASDTPEKWGYWLAKGALAGRGRRAVHLVNRRGGGLDGSRSAPVSTVCRASTSSSPSRTRTCAGSWRRG